MNQIKCRICGGSVGMRRLVQYGLDAHLVCVELAKAGLPTPTLGDDCPACQGIGRIPRSAYGPINPNQKQIDTWAPPCRACAGTGVVGSRFPRR